ncbi:helix-turn-helix transcriptional regulator [bacterium]|nr:helix-turn-helix transcriptional regulator [bacterium]
MIIIKLDDLIWQNKTTADEISKQTGLGSSTISKLRNSKNLNISLNTINKLCKYFNCKVSDLLEYMPD